MTAATIKLRSDLIFSQQAGSEGTTIVIKDPVTERFFRFKEIEHFIAAQFDGQTPPELVLQRVEERFQVRLSPQNLEQFIDRLRRLGLATDGAAGPAICPSAPKRVAGDALYLRFRAFNPDHLFDWLLPRVEFLFTPWFLAVSAGFVAAGLWVTLIHWSEILPEFGGLLRFESLLLAWIINLGVITAHEFSHGLTCKHFGGRVREIGFMLIYFQPAFYCNVSDAWLFPEKSRRMWVTFAGGYFEIFLWGLATVVWRVTEPHTTLHYLALVVTATSGIRTFFNMNPLIKLDGYYLLSDFLDIPNLRQKAVGYWGARCKRAVGLAVPPAQPATPRERWIFRVYGLLAATYSYWLLGLIASSFGAYLVAQYQAWGFVLFAGLLLVLFKQPLRRAAAGLRASGLSAPLQKLRGLIVKCPVPPHPGPLPQGEGIVGAAHRQARRFPFGETLPGILPLPWGEGRGEGEGSVKSAEHGDGARAAARSIGAFKTHLASLFQRESAAGTLRRKPVKVCALFALLATLLWFGRMELRIGGEFVILPVRNADVRAEVEGIIQDIPIEEGDVVNRGGVIARLSDRDHRAELRKTKAEIEEKQARLKLLKAGPRAEEIELARTGVAKAEERLKYARSLLSMDRALFEEKLLSRRDFELTEESVSVRQKDLEESNQRLKVLLAGTRPEEIEALEAEISRLNAQQRHLEEQLRLLTVVSPVTGVVTTHKVKEIVGQNVKKGDLIAKVHELNTVTAEIAVSEKEISEVSVGQPVVLKCRAYPQRSFHGTVTSIAPIAGKQDEIRWGRTVFVTTQLDNTALLLKPEMSGQAKICCGERRLFDLLTRRVARYLRVEFWSWW